MLDLDDPRWAGLKGGYKVPFDPRPLLKRLKSDTNVGPVWSELWNALHHQGDVGEASFAAVPHIVRVYCNRCVPDWNAYAMVAVIELARNRDQNPDVPGWLKAEYFAAIDKLAEKGLSELSRAQDPETYRAFLAVIALKNGLRSHASLLLKYSEEELQEIGFI